MVLDKGLIPSIRILRICALDIIPMTTLYRPEGYLKVSSIPQGATINSHLPYESSDTFTLLLCGNATRLYCKAAVEREKEREQIYISLLTQEKLFTLKRIRHATHSGFERDINYTIQNQRHSSKSPTSRAGLASIMCRYTVRQYYQ